jgi:pilus assembly protein CpaE
MRARRAIAGRRGERGQATVEFALVLPAVAIVVLLVFQAMVLGNQFLLVANAAREGARAAIVDPSGADARAAVARTLPGATLTIDRAGGGAGASLRATVRFHARTSLPFVGALLPDPWLSSTVTMRAER